MVRPYDESFAVHSGNLLNLLPKEVAMANYTVGGFKVHLVSESNHAFQAEI